MYHKDVIAVVARRLPHHTRRDVAEVVEVLTEVWSDHLVQGGEVVLPGIGRLNIEVQDMTAGGALAEYGKLRRVYGRFRPTPGLKAKIEEASFEQT